MDPTLPLGTTLQYRVRVRAKLIGVPKIVKSKIVKYKLNDINLCCGIEGFLHVVFVNEREGVLRT